MKKNKNAAKSSKSIETKASNKVVANNENDCETSAKRHPELVYFCYKTRSLETLNDVSALYKHYENGDISSEEFIKEYNRMTWSPEYETPLAYGDENEDQIDISNCYDEELCYDTFDNTMGLYLKNKYNYKNTEITDKNKSSIVLNILSNKITLDEARHLEQFLFEEKAMCGIGINRVKKFLNNRAKTGDKFANFLSTILQIEEKLAISMIFDTEYSHYHPVINKRICDNLISLLRRYGVHLCGYIAHDCTIFDLGDSQFYTKLYIDLTNEITISYLVSNNYKEKLEPYKNEIMTSHESNLSKIEHVIECFYGEEIHIWHCFNPAKESDFILSKNIMIKRHDQYADVIIRCYPKCAIRDQYFNGRHCDVSEDIPNILELTPYYWSIIKQSDADVLCYDYKEREESMWHGPSDFYNNIIRYKCYNDDGTEIKLDYNY